MLASEREEPGGDALGPTLVVCPMSVIGQWVTEIARFAPSLRVHLHHGSQRLAGTALADAALATDVVVTSYDIATRDVDFLAAVPVGPAAARRGPGREEPDDEACARAAPGPGERRLAMTGTPIENRLGELWAMMDIVNPGLLGSHECSTARSHDRSSPAR